METKQTAVQWFNQQLINRQNGSGDSRSWDEIFKQALEMEREQHGNTWDFGIQEAEQREWNTVRLYPNFDDYYDKTYGGQDER